MGIINLFWGWIGILFGVISGAIIGLFFHQENWMGGYDSYRRRLTRLGHISFFGLGFVNILFGLTITVLHTNNSILAISSRFLLLGAMTMPICCFLSAWHKPYRHLFPIPVVSVLLGIALLLYAWPYPVIP
jgi:hypothetical protein